MCFNVTLRMVFGVKQLSTFTHGLYINVYSTFFYLHPLINSVGCLLSYISLITCTINVSILLFNHFYVSLTIFLTLTFWRLTTYIYIYMSTAQLTSRRCILNIYSTNILTEYFKHAAHSPFFSLFKMPFIS